jgi:hypothetical protein
VEVGKDTQPHIRCIPISKRCDGHRIWW